MPRLDLSPDEVKQARYILGEMVRRDFAEIYFNIEMAKDENVKDLTFGRMMLSIPEDHRRVLALIYPEIDSPDAQIKTKAWKRLMKDEITMPYRINQKETGGNQKGKSITIGH
jgi:hypothetical protein